MTSNEEEDDYLLKWEKHHIASVSYFWGLFKKSMLVDCTLAAEDKYIKAHRMVLMACSPYFEGLLMDQVDNLPIAFVNIKFSELKSIVEYCYRGEVKLGSDELEGFLKAAAMLQIRGLCETKEKQCERGEGGLKRRRSSPGGQREVSENSYNVSVNDSVSAGDVCVSDINEEDSSEAKKPKVLDQELLATLAKDLQSEEQDSSDDSDVDVDTDDESESSVKGDDVLDVKDYNEIALQAAGALMLPYTCYRCSEAFPTRGEYREHRESCTAIPPDHPWKCDQCTASYKNKKDLIRHQGYCGVEVPRLACHRCEKTFKYDRGLKRHLRYCGTDVLPLFKCDHCDSSYRYKRGLRRHQRRCAILRAVTFLQTKGVRLAGQQTPGRGRPASETAARRKKGSGTWVCERCEKEYKYAKALETHRMRCRVAVFRTRSYSQKENHQEEEEEEEEGGEEGRAELSQEAEQ